MLNWLQIKYLSHFYSKARIVVFESGMFGLFMKWAITQETYHNNWRWAREHSAMGDQGVAGDIYEVLQQNKIALSLFLRILWLKNVLKYLKKFKSHIVLLKWKRQRQQWEQPRNNCSKFFSCLHSNRPNMRQSASFLYLIPARWTNLGDWRLVRHRF